MSRYSPRSQPPRRGGNYVDQFREWFQRLGRAPQIIVLFFIVLVIFLLVRIVVTGRADELLQTMLGRVIGLVIGFTLHEWAHAQTAFRLGGYRALPDQSRLSLNPLVHVEPLGIVLALVAGFGWARPVPINQRAFYPNERRDMVTVAFAGPFMNLVVAFVFGLILQILYLAGGEFNNLDISGALITEVNGGNAVMSFIIGVLATVVFFNVLLFFFNLIPLAPLDGWKILLGLLPADSAYQLAQYEQQSTLILFLLIMFGFVGFNPIFALIGPPMMIIFDLFTSFLI
jgi:Zn-dependent protease